jgi:cytochrome c-type biogenesis protein CcsB
MDILERVTLITGIISLVVCFALSLYLLFGRKSITRPAPANKSGATTRPAFNTAGKSWMILSCLALAMVTTAIIARIIASGHGPFSNMYEFSVAFSWGIVVMSLIFIWYYRILIISAIGTLVAFSLLIFASTLPSRVMPLVPALQQSFLLGVHVASAIVSYGALTIGFISALVYLLTHGREVSWMNQPEVLENISYRAVIIGFPFLTLTIILGAIWANIAWGKPWSWDPKETASLVTWLIFAAYLHARIVAGWRGTRSAALLVIGFVAILFTFFGNYIFTGLHSYG